jgi:hypothetical protein
MIGKPHNLGRSLAPSKVAVRLQCDAHRGRTALGYFPETRGDVVARLIPSSALLNFVGEDANERRSKNAGEFSVSDSYLHLLAPLIRVPGIKRA